MHLTLVGVSLAVWRTHRGELKRAGFRAATRGGATIVQLTHLRIRTGDSWTRIWKKILVFINPRPNEENLRFLKTILLLITRRKFLTITRNSKNWLILTTFTVIFKGYICVWFASSSSHFTLAGIVASVACAERPRAFVVAVAGARGGALAVVGSAIGGGPAPRARPARHPATRVWDVW